MFEKPRDVPPDDLDAVFKAKETTTSAQNIFERCGYAAGLN